MSILKSYLALNELVSCSYHYQFLCPTQGPFQKFSPCSSSSISLFGIPTGSRDVCPHNANMAYSPRKKHLQSVVWKKDHSVETNENLVAREREVIEIQSTKSRLQETARNKKQKNTQNNEILKQINFKDPRE